MMDKEICALLKDFGMLDEEIEMCFNLCPGLNIVDLKKAEDCIYYLIKYGYPQDDIGLLLAVNPSILMYEPKQLEKKLKTLGDDIEDVLKNDPFAIWKKIRRKYEKF